MIIYSILLLLVANNGLSGVLADDSSTAEGQCRLPFTEIGGYCLMVETLNTGTWDEMNNFCQLVGGRLAVLNDGNLLYFLIKFIRDNGLEIENFWIGATDVEEEGNFKWVDGTSVRMGAPYWGYQADQETEPNGGMDENCVALWKDFRYDFDDLTCSSACGAICEQVQ